MLRTHIALLTSLLLAATLGFSACGGDDEETLTNAEALEALGQALTSSEGEAVVVGVVEITTNFTIGEAVETAIEELRAFLESQIDCSEVSIVDTTLTIDFGILADNCVYRGYTYAGIAAVTLVANDADSVQVEHNWTNLTNGLTSVTGTGDVTWSASNTSRHVVHELNWDHNGADWQASGDRLQQLIDPATGLEAGVQIDGVRDWDNEHGNWHLTINAVQMRPQDPVPQAGRYVLTTPEAKTLTLEFERVAENVIEATLSGTRKDWIFRITAAGIELEED